MERTWIGMDISSGSISGCATDENGRIVGEKKVEFSEETAVVLANAFPNPVVALEATRGYERVFDALRAHGIEVRVANPRKLALIAHDRLKSDKRDARALAQLARVGYLPEIRVPPRPILELRRICNERRGLVGERTRVKNKIKYWLFSQAIELKSPFGKRGLNALRELAPDHPRLARLLGRLDFIGEQLATVETMDGITRQGNRALRSLMLQAAHAAVRADPRLHYRWERIAARRGKRRAKIAIARWLLSIAWYVLTEKRDYR
jgi:transposase